MFLPFVCWPFVSPIASWIYSGSEGHGPSKHSGSAPHSAFSFIQNSKEACDCPTLSQVWEAEERPRLDNLWQTLSEPHPDLSNPSLPTASVCIPGPKGFIFRTTQGYYVPVSGLPEFWENLSSWKWLSTKDYLELVYK